MAFDEAPEIRKGVPLNQRRRLAIRLRFERRVKMARHDPMVFAELVLRAESDNRSIQLAQHQRVMLNFIHHHQRSIVILPINHAKTATTIAYLLWRIGREPHKRGVIVSATAEQAKKILVTIRDYLVSPLFRYIFPNAKRSREHAWTDTAITLERPRGIKDPTLMAVGLDTKRIQGSRLDLIYVDDLLTNENCGTKEQRDKVATFLVEKFVSRQELNGKVIFTNTVQHPDDALHRMEAQGWATIRMQVTGDIFVRDDVAVKDGLQPAWDDDELIPAADGDTIFGEHLRLKGRKPFDVLWKELYPDGPRFLQTMRNRYPISVTFNKLFMCTARDDDEALCKAEWIEKCKKAARDRGIHSLTESRSGTSTYTGVDLAFSKRTGADYSAIFTFEVLASGHRQILDIQFGRWSAVDLKAKIVQTHRRYDSVVRVENNGAQDLLVQLLVDENVGISIRPHQTGNNKVNPLTGIHAVFNDMAHGWWLIPNDVDGRCHPAVQRWIDECLYYVPDKHTGDVLISSWLAREQAREYGDLIRSSGPSGGGSMDVLSR